MALFRLIRDVLITLSYRWWTVILVVVLNFAAFGTLFALEDQFEQLTGTPVYDTQNDLTPEMLRQQISFYQGEARSAYFRFAAFDFVFPLVAAVFVALIWTLMLRVNTWKLPQRLLQLGLPLFALIVTLWDWLENISLLLILNAGTDPANGLVEAALFFKRLKLTWLFLTGPITLVIGLFLLANVIYRPQGRAAVSRTPPQV